MVRRHVVVGGEDLDLLVGGGDHGVAPAEREELLPDPFLESVAGLDLLGVTLHVLTLPGAE